MAKLFITLYLMVFASFGVFVLFLFGIHALGESFGEGAKIDERVSIGTFKLLEKSVSDLDNLQINNKIQHYQQLFGSEFKRAHVDSFNFDEEQLKILERGHVLTRSEERSVPLLDAAKELVIDEDEEIDILYYKPDNTSHVWRANLDYALNLSIYTDGIKIEVNPKGFAKGMFDVIEQELQQVKKEEWPTSLKVLETTIGMPLSLTSLSDIQSDLENTSEQLAILNKNKIINITQKTNFATFVKKLDNRNKLLQVGPVEIPWYLRNLPLLTLLAFFTAFASTLFLWLRPLWININKIKQAANEFGSGNYNARIPHRGWSPIAKVSGAFNSMAEQTERSIRSQKELTSAVSHELRTPVARMRFALEMLSNTKDQTKKLRFISDINENIEELDELLEELLSYARLDYTDVSLKITENKVLAWFNQTVDRMKPLSGSIKFSHQPINIHPNDSALFEARLMTRVVENIIQNAFRYARKQVKVSLKKGNNFYEINIEDDGKGIPLTDRESIFDAFSRIDASRDRASGGFGLGLAIADRIIKKHNGTITIHDSSLGGARFTIKLPSSR